VVLSLKEMPYVEAARDAGVAEPAGQPQDQDQAHQVLSKQRHGHDGQQHEWNGQQRVDQPHDHDLDRAADKASQEAEQHPDAAGQEDRRRTDEQRHPGAVHRPAEQIATEWVRAKYVHVAAIALPERRTIVQLRRLI